ncbi:MAG: caspase family protein [Pseudomonas sp.]
MPTPTFMRVSVEDFARLLHKFPFTRQINAVHMHHTWRPSRKDFNGHETIVGMWRYHTQTNKWSDIAQHLSIDPQGFIWLGRNWNRPPASASGHNGNASHGPFMFEMIGDFDIGRDPFDGKQRDTALDVVALVQAWFNLPLESLKFHNSMSDKSCPGSALDYEEILEEVKSRRDKLANPGDTRSTERAGNDPFPNAQQFDLKEAIVALSREPQGQDPADAELSHDGGETIALIEQTGAPGTSRGSGLSAEQLADLQAHVVNLSMGRFSADGIASTSKADVDAIFEEHLVTAMKEAKAQGHKLRIVFYAHGGLVKESSGLEIAQKHVAWWKRNGVYPIYFVWETGLFETIGSLLKRAWPGTSRDLADYTSDLVIETAARTLRGPAIWGGMKASAERAADPDEGGSWYVASKLKRFCDANGAEVELHAIGHSAGAIFHAYFLATAHNLGVPVFSTLQLFAPAIRVDTFKHQLLALLKAGKVAQKLTIFTMGKSYEKDDDCAGLYRKSLLYLIFNALEDQRGTPILGLEESLRADSDLKQLFGLDGKKNGPGEVVWSVSASDSGRSASRSTSHGGFDDDPPTLNSAARRLLGLQDAGRIYEYPIQRAIAGTRAWTEEVDWPQEVEQLRRALVDMPGRNYLPPQLPAPSPYVDHTARPVSGRRLALCVGINEYPDPQHRLGGCVADAQMWARALSRLGFATTLLLDGQATRSALDRSLRELIGGSRPGDVIVFQYAGHGTYVADLNGDEADNRDEALCPVDFADGALFIDDDIAEVFAQLPGGVNLTCFMDCCHSGTNTRFAVGGTDGRPLNASNARRRFVPPTDAINRAHVSFRNALGGASRSAGSGGPALMRCIKFAACQDHEVAWESDGHGEFTLRATRILEAGIDGMSHEQFVQQVLRDFGAQPRQQPMLDCTDAARTGVLLQALLSEAVPSGPKSTAENAVLMQTLLQLQQLIRSLAQR